MYLQCRLLIPKRTRTRGLGGKSVPHLTRTLSGVWTPFQVIVFVGTMAGALPWVCK